MNFPGYHIIPYNVAYHEQVSQLEKGIVQGKKIQLEIIKKDFLDRAKVFRDYYSCIAVTGENQVIGSAMGAHTTIMVNRKQSIAGIAFDTKVHPNSRGKGIGRSLVQDIYKNYFNPMGFRKNFMVAKQTNSAVMTLASSAVPNIWFYDFVYLTIPTSTRVTIPATARKVPQLFSIDLFDKDSLPRESYCTFRNGLSYLRTNELYRLRIKKIDWFYKQAILFLKSIDKKYRDLPGENEILSLATLFNHTPENIHEINQVLEDLESKGIQQLLVCCCRQDYIYNVLKSATINRYPYKLVSDFPLDRSDQIVIDVRCL